MKNIAPFFIIFLLIVSCKKNCDEGSPTFDPCDVNSLKIIDSTCFDLTKYVIRNDSFSYFGHATAIKSVPNKGEISWIANNSIGKVPEGYYIGFGNYIDTSWIDLEFWAFRREIILIKFNPYQKGEQVIYDEERFKLDSTVNYAWYEMRFDDFHDGSWRLDTNQKNFINVSSIDTANKVVEGEFKLHFLLSRKSTVPGVVYSDSINFRCGHFKSKIFD